MFSRDCPEYEIRTPGGHRLVVLVNHLKSKGYGTQADNNARRARQAQRVADIYRRRRTEGVSYVAVLGDFNDTPTSAPLAPLVTGTDLVGVPQRGPTVISPRAASRRPSTCSSRLRGPSRNPPTMQAASPAASAAR